MAAPVTETLTNEAPLLTEDLVFDLGDVLECTIWQKECLNEPVWLVDSDCGCYTDLSSCEPCRQRVLAWIDCWGWIAECRKCDKSPSGYTNWRRI